MANSTLAKPAVVYTVSPVDAAAGSTVCGEAK